MTAPDSTAGAGSGLRSGLTGPRAVALAAPLVVAALVMVNAWSGLMPGVGFWDTGEFQTVLPIMGTAHPTGYPTYVLLGFLGNILLTPIGEPAFRVTVLSLLAVATAAGATVVLIRRLTGSTIIGMATGVGLATTPVVWLNATRADPHPIHLMFVALLLLALVRWEHGRKAVARGELDQAHADRRLVLAAVIFGLAEGNHSLTLLLAPPIALYVLSVEPGVLKRPLFVATCLAAAILTMLVVFLELPIRGGLIPAPLVYGRPATWDGFWYIVFAQQFQGSVGDMFANLPQKLDKIVALTSGQLGPLALSVPIAFIVSAWRAPRYTLLTGAALVITVLFNLSYANADIERYYLGPALWIWTWIGILASVVARLVAAAAMRLGGWSRSISLDSAAARPAVLVGAAIVAVVLLMPTLEDLQARRAKADRSTDTGARQWLAEVLPTSVVAQDAMLVSWWSTSTALWYAQKVEGQRPDITIIDDRTMLDENLGRAPDVISTNLGKRPVYVIRLEGRDTDELTSQFNMTLVASSGSLGVWRVDGRLAAQ
ncbi:MAG TPA: DUF2723 domain-containing protein [Candidatus Limnocylindrales bacterium]|nr:DUF2723 domain-containing protein [Candidatus Limnocylindrales bacterium]